MAWNAGNVVINNNVPVPMNSLFLAKANLTGGITYASPFLNGRNFVIYVEGLGLLRYKASDQNFPNSYYSKTANGFTILIPGFDLGTNQLIILY